MMRYALIVSAMIIFTVLLLTGGQLAYQYIRYEKEGNKIANEMQLQADANYNKSMTELCKSYRKWQTLPQIQNKITKMDAICNEFEKMTQ